MKQRSFWGRFCRNKPAVAGTCLLGIVIATAILGPLLWPHSPWVMATRPFVWPGDDPQHPLGSDLMGRDVLSGVIYGARVSLLIGFAATAAALGLGVAVGAVAGYSGGWSDALLMRFTEVFQTMPNFVLAVVLVAIFQPSLATIIFAITMVSWPPIARIVRGEFMSLRDREFVQSCVLIGMSDTRIVLTQILPNCLAPITVMASVLVATAILIEAGLSFLGLGDPNVMSWGVMVANGRDSLRSAWHLSAIPGIAILATVLSLNLVGEGLSDALNPRLKNW
jgi:peptide/nickel transport system permease protein